LARAFFLTFVALSAGAVGFVDYTNQTLRIGATFGDMGLREYAGTFSARYTGMVDGWATEAAARELRAKDMREHLPAAVDGWEMREWNETDRAQLFPAADAAEVPAELQAALDENLLLSALQDSGAREARSEEIAGTRFYQRGSSLIALQLAYQPPRAAAGGITGLSMNIVEGNMAAMSGREGFAVIKGVAYGRSTGLFGTQTDGPRVISGRIGNEIRINVRALASDEEIHLLLSSIDYDLLNGMLERPADGVGSAAADIPLDQQKAAADAVLASQTQNLMARARESEAALMAMADALRPPEGGGNAAATPTGLGALFGMNSGATEDTGAPAQIGTIGDSENCTMIGARKSCGVAPD
jgi:hypothetical protein